MNRYSVERWERGYVEWFVHCREKQNKGLMAWGTGWDGWPILPPMAFWCLDPSFGKGHVWVCGPARDRVCVDVCVPCYHPKPWRYLGTGPPPGPMIDVCGHTQNCHQRPWWHPGSSCGWGPCLGSWSYCSWDMCWSPWPVLPWGPWESWLL